MRAGSPAVAEWTAIFDGETASLELSIADAGEPPARWASRRWEVVLAGGVQGAPAPEALAEAYERQGAHAFDDLRGRFALLILDRRRAELVCVRDPLGVHPLFYAAAGRAVAVSPLLDRLLDVADPPRTIDPKVAGAFLAGYPSRPDETMFAGVRRVPAGHLLRASPGRLGLWRYWDPTEPEATEDVVEEFAHRLRQAVARCHDGQSAVFLSGGLDSATVAEMAAYLSKERESPPPLALSLLLPGEAGEESMQRRVARALGMPQVALPLRSAVPNGRLLCAAIALGGSTATPPGLLQPAYDALIREAAARGCRVVLSGDGGDEWLLPPPQFGPDRLLRLDIPALVDLWRASYRYWPGHTPAATARTLLWAGGVRPLARASIGYGMSRASPRLLRSVRARSVGRSLPAWLAPDEEIRRNLVEAAIGERAEVPPWRLYTAAKNGLLDHSNVSMLLEELFWTERRLGVQIAAPLLDPDLIRLLYRVPGRALVAGGHAKAVGRATVARSLSFAEEWPQTVYGDSIWTASARDESLDAWERTGGVPVLADAGLVDPDALLATVRRVAAGGSPDEAVPICHALCLQSWLSARILGS